MARKVEERRRKKAAEEERKAKEKEDKEAEKRRKKEEMQAALQEEKKQQQEQQQQLQESSSNLRSGSSTASSASAVSVAVADPDMAERLQRIESTLLAMQSASTAWRETAYIDPLDATDPRYLHDTELVVVHDSEMQPSVRFLHRFAVSFLRLVHALPSSSLPTALPPLTVHLASSLPASVHPSCAYKNSFHYSAAVRALYIRRERAEDVGAFLCVLVSAVAHVMAETEARDEVGRRKAKEDRKRAKADKLLAEQPTQPPPEETKDGETVTAMVSAEEVAREEERQRWEAEEQREVVRTWDDRDARFQRHHHRMQQCVMADYFYAASPQTPTNSLRWPLTEADSTPAAETNPQPETVGQTVSGAAVSAVMDLHPPAATSTTPPTSLLSATLYSHLPNFTSSRVLGRLANYSAYTHHTQLTAYLRALDQSHAAKAADRYQQHYPRLPGSAAGGGQQLGVWEAGEVLDECNERLVEVVRVLWVGTAECERAEADERARVEAGEGGGDEKEREKRSVELRDKRWRLTALLRERDELMARLRNLQEADDANGSGTHSLFTQQAAVEVS